MNIYQKESLRPVPWNQLKSDNIETLQLLSELEEPVLIVRNVRKHALLWNKHEYQHSVDILLKIP